MGNQNKFTFNRFMQYQVILILFLTLSGCMSNSAATPTPTTEAEVNGSFEGTQEFQDDCKPSLELNPEDGYKLINKWEGLNPGETTPDEAEQILGAPDEIRASRLYHGFASVDIWEYHPENKITDPLGLCGNVGELNLIFDEDQLFSIRLTLTQSPPGETDSSSLTYQDFVDIYRKPDFMIGVFMAPRNPAETAAFLDQGFAPEHMSQAIIAWRNFYPEDGILINHGLSRKYGNRTVIKWYYYTRATPSEAQTGSITLFEPVPLEEARDHPLYWENGIELIAPP